MLEAAKTFRGMKKQTTQLEEESKEDYNNMHLELDELREEIEDVRDQLTEVKDIIKKDQNKQISGKIMEIKGEFEG